MPVRYDQWNNRTFNKQLQTIDSVLEFVKYIQKQYKLPETMVYVREMLIEQLQTIDSKNNRKEKMQARQGLSNVF